MQFLAAAPDGTLSALLQYFICSPWKPALNPPTVDTTLQNFQVRVILEALDSKVLFANVTADLGIALHMETNFHRKLLVAATVAISGISEAALTLEMNQPEGLPPFSPTAQAGDPSGAETTRDAVISERIGWGLILAAQVWELEIPFPLDPAILTIEFYMYGRSTTTMTFIYSPDSQQPADHPARRPITVFNPQWAGGEDSENPGFYFDGRAVPSAAAPHSPGTGCFQCCAALNRLGADNDPGLGHLSSTPGWPLHYERTSDRTSIRPVDHVVRKEPALAIGLYEMASAFREDLPRP